MSRRLIERFFQNIDEPINKHRRTLNVIAAVRGLSSIYEHLSQPNSLHNTSDELTGDRAAFVEHSLALIARGRYFLSD